MNQIRLTIKDYQFLQKAQYLKAIPRDFHLENQA